MRKRFWIVGFCLFVLLAAAALSIMVGSFAISPSDVLRTLLHPCICSLSDTASAYRTCDSCWKCARCIRRHTAGDYEKSACRARYDRYQCGQCTVCGLVDFVWSERILQLPFQCKGAVHAAACHSRSILHYGLSICVFMAQGNPPDSLFTHRCRCQCRNYRSDQLLSAANEQGRL